jgi:tetratricopeptide (TPR) repeat protein
MKKSILAVLVIALCCSACGGVSNRAPVSVKLTEGLDPSVDTVDSNCAYFYFMWGRTAELEGKLEEAREAYEKALVCDLHGMHIMRRLAVLLINMGKKKDAANWIKRIIDEDPGDTSSRSFLANLYVSMDQPDKAEEIYLEILVKDPENYDSMLLLGSLYARQEKFAQARDVLEKLVKLNPDSFIGHHYLAKIYMETEKFAKARNAFEKALELNWSPFLAFEAAAFLDKNGFSEDALQLYRQIVEEDESNERVRTMIIGLLLRMDRDDEAISEFEELLPYATDILKVEINLSRLLIGSKRYAEAIDHLQSVLDNDPEAHEAKILLAIAYLEKGDEDEAVAILQRIDPDAANYEDATLFLARILVGENKFDAALKLLEERISSEQNRRKSFYPALAAVFQKQQKSEEAERVFREAMDLYPDDTVLLFDYALFQDEQGDADGAMATMEQVLAIDPEEPYALNYIGYSWAERGEKLEMALEYIRKALHNKPNDGFILDSLGWVLFKMGRTSEALTELKKAQEIEPDDPTINEHLGDVYHKLGRLEETLTAWERSLELQKDSSKSERIKKKIEAAGK